MGYQPIEELLPQSNSSRYKLVTLASRRAIELAEGMPKLLGGLSSERPATVALEEIRQKKVELKLGQKQEKKQEQKQEAGQEKAQDLKKEEKKTKKKKDG